MGCWIADRCPERRSTRYPAHGRFNGFLPHRLVEGGDVVLGLKGEVEGFDLNACAPVAFAKGFEFRLRDPSEQFHDRFDSGAGLFAYVLYLGVESSKQGAARNGLGPGFLHGEVP